MVTGRSDVICLLAVLALAGAGCGEASQDVSPPFVSNGGIEGGLGSGLWGDTSSGPTGMHLGCIPGRHFQLAITLRNRSRTAVTLTDAHGSEPAPRIIRRVAVQFRLAPPPPHGDIVVSNLRRWSASAPVPVTIPPGRSGVVQSNFLMGNCFELGPRQVLTVNDAIAVDYRTSDHAGSEPIAQRSARIILTRGPILRPCAPPHHSSSLVALDIPCKTARAAALGCRRFSYGHSGSCSAAGHDWECTSGLPTGSESLERCWLGTKSQSLKIRWTTRT
jgi:hypothetical protein